jgi:hypothetical protein
MCLWHGVMASVVPEFPCYRCAAVNWSRMSCPMPDSSILLSPVAERRFLSLGLALVLPSLKHCVRRFPVIPTAFLSGGLLLRTPLPSRLLSCTPPGLWQGRNPKAQPSLVSASRCVSSFCWTPFRHAFHVSFLSNHTHRNRVDVVGSFVP